MNLPEDYLNELSKRLLAEAPSLNYALDPPEWIQMKDMLKDGWDAFDSERQEIIAALWEKARADLRTHGYSALKQRLADLETDWKQHDTAAKVHEEHARYFTLAGTACKAMAEEHGEETSASATALQLHEKLTAEVFTELREKGWSVSGRGSDQERLTLGMSFFLDEGRIESWGLEHKPPGRDAYFYFDKETWREAAELVGIRRARSLRKLNAILRLRELIEFQSDLTRSVLRRDRLVGWVAPWTPPKPRERWVEGLPEGPDWKVNGRNWDVVRGPIIRWWMELKREGEYRTDTARANEIARRLAEDPECADACKRCGLSPESFSDKRLRDVWKRHKRRVGISEDE